MLISVVGPSRAGKSTLLKAVLPEFPHITLMDLDAEEDREIALLKATGVDPGGWDGRWRRNRVLLEAAEIRRGYVIADVGAGSLQIEKGRRFFIERGARVIAVMAPFEVVLARYRERDPDEFRRTEYSDDRRRVYEAAWKRVDSSRSVENAVAEMRAAIQDLTGMSATTMAMDDVGQVAEARVSAQLPR